MILKLISNPFDSFLTAEDTKGTFLLKKLTTEALKTQRFLFL